MAALTFAIVASAAACASHSPPSGEPAGPAGTPVYGGSLDIGLSGEPASLDSALDIDASGYVVARAIYDPLFQLQPDGSLTPMLAESYTISADAKTVTVTLRDGLEFSDGTALDGAAVLAHYQRLLTTPTVSVPAELRKTTLSAVGNRVTFVAPSPWSSLPALVLTGNIAMIGSAAAQRDNPARYAQYPVGAGPFLVAKYVAGSEVTVVRNPRYWRPGLPYLDSASFHFLTDSLTRLQSVAGGSIDLMQSSDVSQRAEAARAGLNTQVNIGLAPVGIMLNTAHGPLADPRVRVALAQAIDARAISQVVYKGLAPATNDFAPPGSAAAQGSATPGYDEAAAREVIGAYGQQIHITLTTLASADFLDAAQLVQQMWQKVGVKVTIKPIALASMVNTIFVAKDYQAYLSNNFQEGVPASQTFALFVKGAGANPTNLDDPQLNRAYARGLAATSSAAQQSAWRLAEQRMAADLPAIPLVQKVGLFVWRANVHGVPSADPHGVQMFDVTGIWVDR